MRYRTLSPEGDYVFGQGLGEFLINSPEAVAQAVETRLRLAAGEWFLDRNEGTPYATQILGEHTTPLYDQAFRDRIADTQGVLQIIDYASVLNSQRRLSVAATISTIYGTVPLQVSL